MKRTTIIVMVILVAAQIYSALVAKRSLIQKTDPVEVSESNAPDPQPIQ